MLSRYTVVQYLPRPLSGERLNIGLISWSEGTMAARFIENWRRVRAFGHEDTEFLQDFVREIQSSVSSSELLPGFGEQRINETQLGKIIGTWSHSIQFSEPRVSVNKTPKEVLNEIGSIYLAETSRALNRGVRNRRAAAALAARKVLEIMTQEKGSAIASDLVKKKYSVQGKLEEHTFDVVVSKDDPYFAAQALSFELSSPTTLQKDMDATAWAIDDVRKIDANLPLGVLLLPPTGQDDVLFKRAKRLFKNLNAQVVESDSQMERWVGSVARTIPNVSKASERRKQAKLA